MLWPLLPRRGRGERVPSVGTLTRTCSASRSPLPSWTHSESRCATPVRRGYSKGGWCGSLDEPILMNRVAYPLRKGPARWELAPGHFWLVCHRVWGPHLKEDNEHGPGVRSANGIQKSFEFG